MNPTADKKPKPIPKALTKEERALILLEIVKDLTAVEEEGFGRIVIEVKNHQVINWWKVASRSQRALLRKFDGNLGALTSSER